MYPDTLRVDLLYYWERDRGYLLTPRRKLRLGENYQADLGRIPEGAKYLLISLFYELNRGGSLREALYSIKTNLTSGPLLTELRKLLENFWLHQMETLPGLNYRIMGLLSVHEGIKEWSFFD